MINYNKIREEEAEKIRKRFSEEELANEEEEEASDAKSTQNNDVLVKLAEDILKTLKRRTADKYAEITDKVEAKIRRLATKARTNPRLIRTITRRYADILGKEYVRLFEEEERKIWKKIKRRSATEERRKEGEEKVEFDMMFV